MKGDLHLFAHCDRNLVKKGYKVVKNVTPIGTVGNGNGQYLAHLHFSISRGLTPTQLINYISGWSKDKVQKYYVNPAKIDFNTMFGTKVDVGTFGYGWLDWVGYGWHPGVDVNGLKGGNTDFGMPFKASCNGTVVYEWRGWTSNHGWGNLIMVEEDDYVAEIKVDTYITKIADVIQRHEGWIPPNKDYLKGSVAYRQNNPGNLIFTDYTSGLGALKKGDRFAIFLDYATGRRALELFLIDAFSGRLKAYSPDMTILDFFSKYAPLANKKPNYVYANVVASAIGKTYTTKLKELI
jgi:hypothetical protein